MKKIIALSILISLLENISLAQEKKLQLSLSTNIIDLIAAAELKLSENSTLYTGIGFGYGGVATVRLSKYFCQNRQYERNSDVIGPEIFFAPYLNMQYRNYFLKARDIRKGVYTGNNSGIYAGARLKMYTAPVIAVREEIMDIKESYMLGLLIGYQKAFAFGEKRRFIFNSHVGFSTHANYNLSFFSETPLMHASLGYIIK